LGSIRTCNTLRALGNNFNNGNRIRRTHAV
jgi:hypothetical protein